MLLTSIATGDRYRFSGMSGPDETAVLRVVSPYVASLIRATTRSGSSGSGVRLRMDFDRAKLIADAFAAYGALTPADADLLNRTCLAAFSREREGEWVTVWPEGAACPAFPDIDGAMVIRLILSACASIVSGWFEALGDQVPPEVAVFVKTLH